jgi:O-antigen/teichoic acid export membrane protein
LRFLGRTENERSSVQTPFPRSLSVGEDRRARVGQPREDVAPHEIERSLKRGVFWALGAQVGLQAIRLVGVIVLARLLTPDDYGTAALAVTLASFSMILGDLGYGTALVQASTASQRWASTACWCALAAGLTGFGFVALGAYPAARALNEPEVTGLVIAAGLTLFLVAAGSTSNALLTRSMTFGVIQSAGVAASAFATASAIAAAALGAGAWALVLQQVALAAVTSAWFIVAARWLPSLAFSRAAFRFLSRFAIPVTGGSVFFVLQGLVTVLLIGRLVGIDELGIWSLSMAIVIIPLSLVAAPLSRVIYAAFARMRDNQQRVAEVWLDGFVLLASIVLPALFGLIAVAPDLIPLVFGSQWVPAVPVVQILCIFVMSRTLQTWNNSVMDAAGKPHVAMILNASVLIALPPSIWFGSAFGIEGVAIAYSLAALLCGELPSFLLTTRELSLRPLSVLGRLRGIVLSSAAAFIAVLLARLALEDAGVGIEPRVSLLVVVGAVVYFLCLTLCARDVARQLLGVVGGLRPTLGAKFGRG